MGFVYVMGYVTFHWMRTGRHIMRVKDVVAAEFSGGPFGGVVEARETDKALHVEEKEVAK